MRIVYRLVEFGPGINQSNPLLSHEIYPFMLDGFPMLLALTTLNVIHPGLVLRGPDADFPRLTRAEKKAKKQLKKDLKTQNKEAKRQLKMAKKSGSSTNFELLEVPSQRQSIDLEASQTSWNPTSGHR